MWNLLRNKTKDCNCARETVENTCERSSLPSNAQQHLTRCADCAEFADKVYASRALLNSLPSKRYQPSPWFATRVMSAIAAREAAFSSSLETWRLLPRLAARLAGVSALALLLTGAWLYERPATPPGGQSSAAGESLFENAPAPAPDDLVAAVVEAE